MKKYPAQEIKSEPLRIVNGALMATADHVQGRAAPVLIVDCQDRKDIADLFTLHRHLGRLGGCRHAWLRGGGSTLEIFLRLDFIDPVVTQVLIRFEVPGDGVLIEMILKAECFYLQSGRLGDNMLNTDGSPKILIEALSAGFEDEWHRLHIDILAPKFKKKGRSRKVRIEMAEKAIQVMGSYSQLQIPQT